MKKINLKKIKGYYEKGKKVYSKLKDPYWRAKSRYMEYYDTLPIAEKSILLETQHGSGIMGNIFYLIRYLANSDKYKEYSIYLTARARYVNTFYKFLENYGIHNVKIVVLSTDEYFKVLASAKYVITDVSFTPMYIKKEGQVYLNTWHGTPLKTLGKSSKIDAHLMGNIQKNLVAADYLLFPNEHTKNVIIDDYMLENISQGSYIYSGYPRNEAFFDEDRRQVIKEELGLEGKRIYSYMPTYRGVSSSGGTPKNTYYLNYYLYELDRELTDDEILYVNLHPLAKKDVQFKGFKHIRQFPSAYETYDFLNITDVLITDYSSVFFDFACTNRKIILFTYDKDEYLADRGMYLEMDEFPFPQVSSVEALVREMRNEKDYDDSEFIERYCKYERKDTSSRICDYIIQAEDNGLESEQIPCNNKENVLIYAGNLSGNGITASLRSLLNVIDLDRRNYYFAFYSERVGKNKDAIFSFPPKVNYFAMTGDLNLSIRERVIRKLFKKKWIKADKYMDLMRHRVNQELSRCLGGAKFDHMIQFNGYEQEVILGLSTFAGNKSIYVHNDMVHEINVKGNQRYDVLRYAYRNYDKVSIVTEDMYKPTVQISDKGDNIQVVKNIIDYKSILEKAKAEIQFDSYTKTSVEREEIVRVLQSNEAEVFINIGRFAPEKGHERLVDAFCRYYQDHPNAYLIIMGGYSLDNRYNKLRKKVEEMHLERNVILIEKMSNPYPILKECDYLVLSSYYEGFGLVLAEADMLNIPVVSTDIPGPRGFMKKHGGTLVEDSEEGVYQGLCMLHEGKVKTMNVDYEKYNQEAVEEFERLLG